MPFDPDEYWYRCRRCLSCYKLKNLIIRHLISHGVHRFENDSDYKCVEDWERVEVLKDGSVIKVEVKPADDQEALWKNQNGRELLASLVDGSSKAFHAHQETNWVIRFDDPGVSVAQSTSKGESAQGVVGGMASRCSPSDPSSANLNFSDPTDTATAYLGPFDPLIEQSLLKLNKSKAEVLEEFSLPASETLYYCRYCTVPAPFATSRSRGVHESKAHNQELDGYPCHICNKNFPSIPSVQDHYRCTHKMIPPVKKVWREWKTGGGNVRDYMNVNSRQAAVLRSAVLSGGEDVMIHEAVHFDDEQSSTPLQNSVSVQLNFTTHTTSMALTEHQDHALLEQDEPFETYYFSTEEVPANEITISDSDPPIIEIETKPRNGESQMLLLQSSQEPLKKSAYKKPISPPSIPHPQTPPCKVIDAKSSTRYQRLKCPRCEERFRTQWEQTVHLGEVHSEFTCEFCSQVFSQKLNMVQHQHSQHNVELGNFQCRFCRKNFGTPRIVQEHVFIMHQGHPVPSSSVALKWRRA